VFDHNVNVNYTENNIIKVLHNCHRLLGSRGSNWFTAHMIGSMSDLFQKRFQESPLIIKLMTSKKDDMPSGEVISSWFASWLVSALTWWLRNGMKYSPQQMASWNRDLWPRGFIQHWV
jgi:hypothetical protein